VALGDAAHTKDPGDRSPIVGDSHGLSRRRMVDAKTAVGGDEAGHFTPWLARNIDVLGETIGLNLAVLEAPKDDLVSGKHIEVAVGSYYLDIKATDSEGRIVAIENQYGTGDHRHLGQLLTYASGVGADIAIWVAESFSEPHIETLRWLNERTDDQCGFFAVRAHFVTIDNSAPAPMFELATGPSEWARIRREATVSAEKWTLDSFLEAVEEDRDVTASLFDRIEAAASGHGKQPFWYGRRPHGSIFMGSRGQEYSPVYVWINSHGRAMVTGTWRSFKEPRANHPAYRHVAEVLGQDHTGSATGVPLAELDLDVLTAAIDRTAKDLVEAFGPGTNDG
jgi:hypothetical protein